MAPVPSPLRLFSRAASPMTLNFNAHALLPIFLAAAAFVVFIIWTYRQVMKELTQRAGWWMTGLRIGAVGVLLATLCEPAASLVLKRSQPAALMLMVDTSASMNLTDRQGNRAENVTRLFDGGWLAALKERYRIHAYRFAETATPLPLETLDTLAVQKQATDLGGALRFARARARTNKAAGVILITDGNHTVGPDPLRIADRLGLPVYTIGVGDTLETRDVAVVRHLTNEVAYVESRIPVEVTLRSRGIDGTTVPVTLLEGGRTVDKAPLRLTGDGREQSLLFHVVPTEDGIHRYTVSVPVQPGELITGNNRYSFSIKVLKNKLRVLYIEGKPRADVTFLKQTLERDPNVGVTRLLARPDRRFYPDPMPDTRSAWFRYDLIILGSIPAGTIQPWERMIVAFVEQKGGGLIALGGPESFGSGGYAGTPVGDMLPVRIPEEQQGLLEGLFLPVLTPDGQAHPLMRLDDDPAVSIRLWSELPPLPGINQVGPAKPGATVLAVHPTWRIDGKQAPVIAIQRYGLGKVMAIAAYGLWRWDLMMWGTGRTGAGYERFWSNAVRWLTTREGNRRVRVTTGKTQYGSGESIEFNGQVYDDRYRPIDDATVVVRLTSGTDERQQVNVELHPAGAGAGLYRGVVKNLPAGAYTYHARATQYGRTLGAATGGFNVGEPTIEYDRTTLNQDLLRRLAAATEGRFYYIADADRFLREVDVPATILTRTREIQLWNHPVTLLLFILLLSIEWLLRRRHGLT